jgi:hypothetical protein
MDQPQFDAIRAVLVRAAEGPAPVFDFGGVLTGFSGERLLACLHGLTAALCGHERVYLEIGVFQGLTLISNARVNSNIKCFGIDNFSLFNDGRDNFGIVRERMSRLGVTNATIINRDFEDALDELGSHIGRNKIGVFFVDGAHDYRSQLVSLLKAKPYLARGCAIVVDDANYGHVRQANADFLRSHPDFALLMEGYTSGHMANLTGDDRDAAAAGFWNGVNILIHDPEHRMGRAFPREEPKDLYFQSHDVFRHEFAELAFPALKALQEVLDSKSGDSSAIEDVLRSFAAHRSEHPGRFRHQNTGSEGLPAFQLHP